MNNKYVMTSSCCVSAGTLDLPKVTDPLADYGHVLMLWLLLLLFINYFRYLKCGMLMILYIATGVGMYSSLRKWLDALGPYTIQEIPCGKGQICCCCCCCTFAGTYIAVMTDGKRVTLC